MSFVVNTLLSLTLLTVATFLFSLTNGAIKESQYSYIFTTKEYRQISKKRVRKEIRDLSRKEWQRIVDAMNIMKTLSESEGVELYGKDYRNYDDLLCQHLSASWSPIYGDIAHKNVAFLPFHRAFGNAFENSLLAIDSKIEGLPYWDYTIDEQAYGLNGNIENTCHLSQSEIFSEDYFGAYRGEETLDFAMIDGQFADWRVTNEPEAHGCSKDMYDFNTQYLRGSSNYLDTPYITRFGNGVDRNETDAYGYSLVNMQAWEYCLEGTDGIDGLETFIGESGAEYTNTEDISAFEDCLDHTVHAVLHVFVGSKTAVIEREGIIWDGDSSVGDYNDGAGSVNDPLFFFHHANVDRYWYHWQLRHYNAQTFGYGYPEINPSGAGKGLDDSLNSDYPFINVLKLDPNVYEDEYYEQDKELTFRDVLGYGDFLHESYVYDSILLEIKPSDLQNDKQVQDEANNEDSEDTVAEEDIIDISDDSVNNNNDNDDETDVDLSLNFFDDNDNVEVFNEKIVTVSTDNNKNSNTNAIDRFTDKAFEIGIIIMVVCLVIGLLCTHFIKRGKNVQSYDGYQQIV